ncbi:MAG: HAD hydrolase-like protein [Candidatus Izemoplasmatales bacterium]|jgi:phosphoglycolate phosphatase-like HAD superfamily hydrolase
MKKAFIDFDGTLVYVYKRYHAILNDYLTIYHNKKIDYKAYIDKKIMRFKDHEIVFSVHNELIDIMQYHAFKLENLENQYYLNMDELIPDIKPTLLRIKEKGYTLELLSYRNNEIELLNELKRLSIFCMFDKITALIPCSESNQKSSYISSNLCGKEDVVIGDSPTEMEAAKENGLLGIFVKTGLFSTEYNDYGLVCENINEAIDKI